MRNSKYLILSSFYFDFNNDLTEITNVKKSFKKQTILDLYRYNDFKIIKKSVFSIDYNLNFIYLPKNIEIIDNFAFYKNQIQILNLSNCINLKIINEDVFLKNQIKHLKLPKNIEEIYSYAFKNNQIESLDLSNYTKLKRIRDNAFSNNPLNEIKILDNINVDYYENNDDLWNKFAIYYNDNNKKAGDYKLENNEWQWYPL